MPGRRGRLAIAAAVLVVAAAFVAALAGPLTRDELRPVARNLTPDYGAFVILQPGETICQDEETLLAEATRVRIPAGTAEPPGGPLALTYRDGPDGPVVARGTVPSVAAGGESAGTLEPGHPELVSGTLCIRNRGDSEVSLGSSPAGGRAPRGAAIFVFYPSRITSPDGEVRPFDARVSLWYPEREPRPAIALAGRVAERAGMWRGDLGSSATSWLALALLLGAGAGGVLVVVRGWSGRRGALAVALVAVASGAAWAWVTPPLQIPDETGHVAYLQYVAEHGKLPSGDRYDPSQQLVEFANRLPATISETQSWSLARERALEEVLPDARPTGDGPGVGYVGNNPPLYYALMAAPYHLGGDFSERLMLVRFATALLGGLAAALVFALVAELAPRRPVLAGVAGLAVALQPVVGFLGGGISPDMLLIAEGAALCWLGVRALRHGLRPRGALAIGAVLAAALVTKPAALGLVPGVLVFLLAVALRGMRARRAATLGAVGLVLVTVVALYLGYREIEEPLLGRTSNPTAGFEQTTTATGRPVQLREGLSYAWQWYLPRLGFMTDQHAGWPAFDIYWQGFVGRFGWHEFAFPRDVAEAASAVLIALLVLAASGAWALRAALRRRWMEVAALVLGALALALVVAAAGYRYRIDTGGQPFEQVRYLFPYLLPLYGGLVALAVAGARRFAVPVAAGLVTAFALHNVAAIGLTVQRYYL